MTRARRARVVVLQATLRLGSFLEVSFQRYPRPQSGVLAAPSPSFGALPVGAGADGALLVPLGEEEALWLGFLERSPRVAVLAITAVETPAGALVDASSGEVGGRASDRLGLAVPPARALDGVPRGDGTWWPLTRAARAGGPSCAALHLTAMPARQLSPAARRREVILPLREPAIRGHQEERSDATAPMAPDPGRWRDDRAVTARIALVDPETFSARTGLAPPGPLRPNAAYRGWRLP